MTVVLDSLDWPFLQKHLDEIGLNNAMLEELLGYVRRASSFIMPYANEKGEARRADFLGALQQRVRDALVGSLRLELPGRRGTCARGPITILLSCGEGFVVG